MTTNFKSDLNLYNKHSNKNEKTSKFIQKQREKHYQGKYKVKQDINVNDFAIEEEQKVITHIRSNKNNEDIRKMNNMEIDYTLGTPERDLKLFRSYMNSKIDIFQNNDGYVYRNGSKTNQKYFESFEHRQIQDESAKILTNSSNLLVYLLGKNENSLHQVKRRLIKTFSQNEIENKENDLKHVEMEYNKFKKKVMQKKLENDREYKQLCELIDHPRFHEVITKDKAFLNYVLNHKYLAYHPKYEEIVEKYRKYFCPIISTNEEDSEENEEI